MERNPSAAAASDRRSDAPRRSEHGHSVAAWTTVSLVIAGFLVGGIGVWVASALLFWIGAAVVLLSWAVGASLSFIGLGSVPSYSVEYPADSPIEGPDRPRS